MSELESMVAKVSEELAPYIKAGEEVIDSSLQAGSDFIDYVTGGGEEEQASDPLQDFMKEEGIIDEEGQAYDPLNDFMRQQGIIDEEGQAGDIIEKEYPRQPLVVRPTIEEEMEGDEEYYSDPIPETVMPEEYTNNPTATMTKEFYPDQGNTLVAKLGEEEGVSPHILNNTFHLAYGIIPDKGTISVNGEQRAPTEEELRGGTAQIDLSRVTKEGVSREEFVEQARASTPIQGRTKEEYERVIQQEAGKNFATKVVEVYTDKTKKALKGNPNISSSFKFNKLTPTEQSALVDIAWNIGNGAMKKWKDIASLANELTKKPTKRDRKKLLEFTNNITFGGKRSKGLLKRRLAVYNTLVSPLDKAHVIKVEQSRQGEWVFVAYTRGGNVLRTYTTSEKPTNMDDLPVPQGE